MLTDEVGGHGADQHDDEPLVEAVGDEHPGHRDSLVGDVEPAVDRARAQPDPGKRGQYREVEDHLHQQRDIAEGLDPYAAESAYEPVVREAGEPDDHTEDRGEEDAGNRHAQGVDHAGPQRPGSSVGVCVDALAELDVDGSFEEVERRADVACPKVVAGLAGEEPHGAEHHDQQNHLGEPFQDDDIAPQRHTV